MYNYGTLYSVTYRPLGCIVVAVEGTTSGYDSRWQYATIEYGEGQSKTIYFYSNVGSSSISQTFGGREELLDYFTADEIASITCIKFTATQDAYKGAVHCSQSCCVYGYSNNWSDAP